MPYLPTSLERTRPAAGLRAWLRVSAYVTLLGLALGLWSARRVYAEAELVLGGIAAGLATELDPELIAEPQRLSINGQVLLFSARHSPLAISEVLARFEASCRAADVPPDSELPAGRGRPASLMRELFAFVDRLRVLRSESDGEARLLCFAPPTGKGGLAGMVAGVQELAASGDFAQLGQLRHVTARALPDGSSEVHTLWTEGPLLLAALFPATGDAPGHDPSGVPRPQPTRRIASAHAAGRSFGLHVYESPTTSQALASFYERALVSEGFRRVPELASQSGDLVARTFTRGDRALVLGLRSTAQGSIISLVDLGAVQHQRAEVRAASF